MDDHRNTIVVGLYFVLCRLLGFLHHDIDSSPAYPLLPNGAEGVSTFFFSVLRLITPLIFGFLSWIPLFCLSVVSSLSDSDNRPIASGGYNIVFKLNGHWYFFSSQESKKLFKVWNVKKVFFLNLRSYIFNIWPILSFNQLIYASSWIYPLFLYSSVLI